MSGVMGQWSSGYHYAMIPELFDENIDDIFHTALQTILFPFL